jgi:hypothetical protein
MAPSRTERRGNTSSSAERKTRHFAPTLRLRPPADRAGVGVGVAVVITVGIEKPVAIKADPTTKEAAAKTAAMKTPAPETSAVTSETSAMTSTPAVTSATSAVGFGSPNANRGTEGQSNDDSSNQELAVHEARLFSFHPSLSSDHCYVGSH